MFMLAPFWSVVLVNAGMIGVAIEAITGRVLRLWLIPPVLFYGAYAIAATDDHKAMRALAARYDAANAKVTIPFDPKAQVLMFTSDGDGGSWYVQNYNLPVAYSRNANYPEGARSHRMMASAICAKVRESSSLRAAQVYTFGFHDGDAIGSRKFETRFCDLGMPERPTLPHVTVERTEEKMLVGTLPVTRVKTVVTTSDGRKHALLGGVAAPLSWFPKPVMGCALNSGAPSWDCGASFWRNGFTPIVSGNTRYSRDSVVLARALGLKRVRIEDRKGGDATLVLAKLEVVERATRERQLAALDRIIADPLVKDPEWNLGVISSQPHILDTRAEAIMAALERVAATGEDQIHRARGSGRILGGLVVELPPERFTTFGPRILALYRANFDDWADRGGPHQPRHSHWLWEVEGLLRRIGDLGPDALPILVDPRASIPNVNGAGIEGLCRIGPAGKKASGPVLIKYWQNTGRFDRDKRRDLFVAMRRIGIVVPPLDEGMEQLEKEWGDVTPSSPVRICSVRSEWQARREEQFSGKRKTNLR